MRISTGTTGKNKSNCPFRRRTKRQAIMGNEVFSEYLWYGTLQNTTETSHSLCINISEITCTQAQHAFSHTDVGGYRRRAWVLNSDIYNWRTGVSCLIVAIILFLAWLESSIDHSTSRTGTISFIILITDKDKRTYKWRILQVIYHKDTVTWEERKNKVPELARTAQAWTEM